MKVKLQDVVDAMDMVGEEMSAYLNKKTGELITITNEEFEAAEESAAEEFEPAEESSAGDGLEEEVAENQEIDLADYPEWQRESILKAREILGSEDWVGLPSKFDIHEYAIMEEFCRSVVDTEVSNRLLNTIRGSGAFRRFRGAIEALDLLQEWYDFRAAEFERIAVGWLEENAIEYSRTAEGSEGVN
jgi:hypothetical protein